MREKQPAYAIFEGGGARGISHIGAVKALEQENFRLLGVAGASAGAIVAALLAAGYTADQIFNVSNRTHILQKQETTPIGLLGTDAWHGFTGAQQLFQGVQGIDVGRELAVWLIALLLCIVVLGKWAAVLLVLFLGLLFALVWPWWRTLVTPLFASLGLFSTGNMVDVLNEILREGLRESYRQIAKDRAQNGLPDPDGNNTREPPKTVTFGDLDPILGRVEVCRRLKVVVSDVSGRCVQLFDHTTPDVPVAQAVAASAAIPLFFAPPKIDGEPDRVFADGGLVSNLPVWVFANERLRQERELQESIPTYAFSLTEEDVAADGHPAKPVTVGGHVTRVARTGIFGSQEVVARTLADVVRIALPSRLGTFEFGVNKDDAAAAFQDGLNAAADVLARQRLRRSYLEALLDQVQRFSLGKLKASLGSNDVLLRVRLYEPVRDQAGKPEGFRTVAQSGCSNDPDAQLIIDNRNRGVPRAYEEATPVYLDLRPLARSPKDNFMTPAEHALVRQGLQSLIALPILSAKGVVERVLCIDAGAALESIANDREFQSWLVNHSVLLRTMELEKQIDELLKNERTSR